MNLQHLNPEGLHDNPAFTQAIVVPGGTATVYIGGQNSVDASGEVVGVGDIAAQTDQVYRNIEIALAAAGAELEHLVKLNIHLVEGQPIEPGFSAWQRMWGDRSNPPLITVLYVSGLAHPDYLVEIDALAAIPEG